MKIRKVQSGQHQSCKKIITNKQVMFTIRQAEYFVQIGINKRILALLIATLPSVHVIFPSKK